MDGLAANLARAQEAISRARTLSVQLQVRVTAGNTNQREPEQPGQVELPTPLQLSETSATGIQGTSEQAYDSMQGARQDALQPAQEVHSRQEHDAWQERAGSSVQAGSGPYSARISPMMLVAQKLSLLQRQQSNTMQQLMLLRLEQLSLRQQQLTALGELLRVEVQAVEGTPQQVAAVAQALLLLDASREESEDVALALLAAKHEEHLVTSPHSSAASAHTAAAADGDAAGDAGQGEDVHGIRDDAGASSLVGMSAAVSRADMRAEEVSHMARQLLNVLREYPRRSSRPTSTGPSLAGASEAALSALPATMLTQSSPLLGEACMICLDVFEAGEELKCLQCVHFCHSSCLEQWLRIKAVCPLCKVGLQGA